jgi:hypothetical protein
LTRATTSAILGSSPSVTVDCGGVQSGLIGVGFVVGVGDGVGEFNDIQPETSEAASIMTRNKAVNRALKRGFFISIYSIT